MAKAGSGDTPARKAKAKGTAKKAPARAYERPRGGEARAIADLVPEIGRTAFRKFGFVQSSVVSRWREIVGDRLADVTQTRSEEHTPELQSLLRLSYAAFCLQKKQQTKRD